MPLASRTPSPGSTPNAEGDVRLFVPMGHGEIELVLSDPLAIGGETAVVLGGNEAPELSEVRVSLGPHSLIDLHDLQRSIPVDIANDDQRQVLIERR